MPKKSDFWEFLVRFLTKKGRNYMKKFVKNHVFNKKTSSKQDFFTVKSSKNNNSKRLKKERSGFLKVTEVLRNSLDTFCKKKRYF